MILAVGPLNAQTDLPLYEVIGNTGFLVARENVDIDSLTAACDTLSVLHGGLTTYALLDSLHLWHVPSCCGFPDTLLYAAHYPLQQVDLTHTCYVNGVVTDHHRLDSLPSIPLDAWSGDHLLWNWHPLKGTYHTVLEYRWQVDSSITPPRTFLFQRLVDRDPSQDVILPMYVPRERCRVRADGELSWLTCDPLDDPSREPVAYILFMGLDLAGVILEHAHTSVDGYGLFRASARSPLAAYSVGTSTRFALASGEVVEPGPHRANWNFVSPLRYYGECDCP